MQQMVGILSRLEQDSHGQPLHYFYVVAGSVFRRQQAEPITARARHMLDITALIPAERIDVNCDGLASVHAGELCFLEVRDHPDVIGLGHEHQSLSWLDTRAELDRALAGDPIRGGVNLCVAEVEQRLIERGPCRIGIRLACGYRLKYRARRLAG